MHLLKGASLVIVLMCSTIAVAPWVAMVVPIQGDYSDTVEVEYFDASSEGFVIEAPASSNVTIGRGTQLDMWRYVTPDDPSVKTVADAIASSCHGSDVDIANAVQRFVYHQFEYVSDEEQWGCAERWQLPCETIRLGTGDCEDMALLYVSIMSNLRFDCVLVMERGHVSAGVHLDDMDGMNTVVNGGIEYATADPVKSHTVGETVPGDHYSVPTDIGWEYALFMSLDLILLTILLVTAWRLVQ